MFTVTIQKRFVSGMLKNLEVTETIKFPTWYSAEQYMQWAEQHTKEPVVPCAGDSQYIIECVILEAA